jgi:hypothetical protein
MWPKLVPQKTPARRTPIKNGWILFSRFRRLPLLDVISRFAGR